MDTFDKCLLSGAGVFACLLVFLAKKGTAEAAAMPSISMRPYTGDPAADADGARTPVGQRMEKVPSPPYPGEICASVRSMHALAMACGLNSRQAALFVAHVSRETGFGRQIWNNNFGNIKEYYGGPWYRHGNQPYKAYATPREGMCACLAFLNLARYAGPRAKLLAGDTSWYGDLGRASYYEGDPTEAQSQYDSVLRRVQACIG